MENTYSLDSDYMGAGGLAITDEIKSYLRETAKWGKFLSIIGFITSVLVLLAAIFMMFVGGSVMDTASPYSGFSQFMGPATIAGLYLLIGLLYLLPSLFLYRFSNKIRSAVDTNDQILMAEGFKNLKSLYKFFGILTVVIIAFYLLVFVGTFFFMGSQM